jgi:vacuolar-type H+-ATPase subunit F/Vma7
MTLIIVVVLVLIIIGFVAAGVTPDELAASIKSAQSALDSALYALNTGRPETAVIMVGAARTALRKVRRAPRRRTRRER